MVDKERNKDAVIYALLSPDRLEKMISIRNIEKYMYGIKTHVVPGTQRLILGVAIHDVFTNTWKIVKLHLFYTNLIVNMWLQYPR